MKALRRNISGGGFISFVSTTDRGNTAWLLRVFSSPHGSSHTTGAYSPLPQLLMNCWCHVSRVKTINVSLLVLSRDCIQDLILASAFFEGSRHLSQTLLDDVCFSRRLPAICWFHRLRIVSRNRRFDVVFSALSSLVFYASTWVDILLPADRHSNVTAARVLDCGSTLFLFVFLWSIFQRVIGSSLFPYVEV